VRLSVRKNDPGYHSRAWGVVVYLNGQKISNCVTADEEKGEVFLLKKDSDGAYMKNRAGDDVKIERKTGEVRIVVPVGFKPIVSQL